MCYVVLCCVISCAVVLLWNIVKYPFASCHILSYFVWFYPIFCIILSHFFSICYIALTFTFKYIARVADSNCLYIVFIKFKLPGNSITTDIWKRIIILQRKLYKIVSENLANNSSCYFTIFVAGNIYKLSDELFDLLLLIEYIYVYAYVLGSWLLDRIL